MYEFLRGRVVSIDAGNRLAFEVNGVGYSLRISDQTRKGIPLDGAVTTVYVRLQVKEDDLVLFGFADVAERAAFDLLTSVQMVGPTVAMGILSAMGVGDLRRALIAKDVAALKKVKGVGPKSAERIALELADKVERIPAPLLEAKASGVAVVEEAHRALVVLGFSPKEASDALQKAVKPAMPTEELLRAALAILR